MSVVEFLSTLKSSVKRPYLWAEIVLRFSCKVVTTILPQMEGAC